MSDMVEQAKFDGWAKVEIMGHQSHMGHVTTEAYGGVVLFRIDRPGLPEEEITLESSEWVGDMRAAAGSIVKRPALEPVSVLVGAGSIYRIIPCTEDAAMKAIRQTHRPLMVVKLAEVPALPSPEAQFYSPGNGLQSALDMTSIEQAEDFDDFDAEGRAIG